MNTKDLYTLYTSCYSISTDTRKITKDSLFFALKGDNFNGNEFAEKAIALGASYAIVDQKEFATHSNIILVKDVLRSLQSLATHHRRQLAIPILAITGSNGKTTTKELIDAVLSKKYTTCATVGNLNNHIGVPLTLLSMKPATEIGIVEMGANHLEEIAFLCTIAQPDYGYITNFGKAHLEGFGGFEGVIKGKSELYNYLAENDKTVFINADDKKQLELTTTMHRLTFKKKDADYEIAYQGANPFVELLFKNELIKSNLIGAYNFTNIASAAAIGTYFKVELDAIKGAIESYSPDNNRSQLLTLKSNNIILDAYNANPSSMMVALDNFSYMKATKKMAILGDMFELGAETDKEHIRIANTAANLSFDAVFLIGEHFFKNAKNQGLTKVFKNFESFKIYFSNLELKDTSILIKASRGMALERTLELL